MKLAVHKFVIVVFPKKQNVLAIIAQIHDYDNTFSFGSTNSLLLLRSLSPAMLLSQIDSESNDCMSIRADIDWAKPFTSCGVHDCI